jgi:hypothetical protein
MLYAPLEQFQILSLISIKYLILTSITNSLLINILAFVSFMSFIYYNSSKENYLKKVFIFSHSWQKGSESISEITAQLISGYNSNR